MSKIPPGTILFRPGGLCTHFPLLLRGALRITRNTMAGREILLYRLAPGETCILTTACLLSSDIYAASAVSEMESEALMLQAGHFHQLLDRSSDFQKFVFSAFAARMAALMQRIEDLIDQPVEARLAACLLASCNQAQIIYATHQSLARDIGSAREVVSRTLARMAVSGLVQTKRGQIEILNPSALAKLTPPNLTPLK